MSRPSRNTDQQLIQAALELLPETGFSGLSLRRVAQRADVNLGMFHYHFRDKREFCRRVMAEFYEKFYAQLAIESGNGHPAMQLRKTIGSLARFCRDNRALLLVLGRDIMDGNQQVITFLEDNFHRHISLVLRQLRQCQNKGILVRIPLPVALAMIMASLAGPSVVMALVERTKFKTSYEILKKAMVPLVLSDQAIEKRLDLVFKALTPGNQLLIPRRRRL